MIAGTLSNVINTEPELLPLHGAKHSENQLDGGSAQEQWLHKAASYPLVRPFLRPIKNRNPIRLVFERTLVTKKIPNLHQSQIQQ